MASTLPIQIQVGALPPNAKYTPQQLAEAIAERMSLVTSDTYALFVTGSTAPTSNVGPWLRNGETWYVWSDDAGAYIPQSLGQQSLGYILSNTAPDPDEYQVWIELAPSGQPVAVKTYYDGDWVDVYEATLADYMTLTAFATAIANYPTTAQVSNMISSAYAQPYPAQGTNSISQAIQANGVAVVLAIGSAPINPSPGPLNTTTNRYIAPDSGIYHVSVTTQFDNTSAAAATVEVQLGLTKNGGSTIIGDTDGTPSPNGARWSPSFSGLVQLAANDYLQVTASVGDGVGTGFVALARITLNVYRVSA